MKKKKSLKTKKRTKKTKAPARIAKLSVAGGSKPKRKSKPRKSSKSRKSVKKFKLEQFGSQLYLGLLKFCNQVVKNYQKNKYSFLVGLLVVALIVVFSGLGPGSQKVTSYEANQEFVSDYLNFWSESYVGLIKQSLNDTVQGYSAMLQPLGRSLGKIFATSGDIFSQTRSYKYALSDTVQAYSAMLQPAGKLLAKAFNGSGEVLAVVSYAISTPARVMAMANR